MAQFKQVAGGGSGISGGQPDPVIEALWAMGDYFLTDLWPLALFFAIIIWLHYKGYNKPLIVIGALSLLWIVWRRIVAG